jgi:pimeloyl-ACP methyl ester carboxylesterase
MRILCGLLLLATAAPVTAQPTGLRQAIYTDPPHDRTQPARSEVIHIPSGRVLINGLVYIAAGPGAHPTMVLMHGLPGNEKNLDLAQAVRRAGWNAVTFNYRGSWGSPGRFSFAGNLEDARAVVAYVRDPVNARRLNIDNSKIVLAGHSMGGWVAVKTAEQDAGIAGVALISAVNLAEEPGDHRELVAHMASDMESLAGVTPETMASEIESNRSSFDWTPDASQLAHHPLLILTANDRTQPMGDDLARRVSAIKGSRVAAAHVATDHSWSDARIELEERVLEWLEQFQ